MLPLFASLTLFSGAVHAGQRPEPAATQDVVEAATSAAESTTAAVEPRQTTVEPRQTTVEPRQTTVEPRQTTVEPRQTTFRVQPIATGSADQSPTARFAPTTKRLIINGVGDFNLDPGYIPAFVSNGYEHALSGMDGLFLEDDLTVINLECPASYAGTRVPKQFNFQCDPAALPIIRDQGVEVANQANNHSLDFGSEGLLDSLLNIEAAGIATVGAGEDVVQAAKPALFRFTGRTVAVVGFGGVIPAASWLATEERAGMSDGDTIESMVAQVEAADRMADIVVVTIHWGTELQTGPPSDDIARAEAMIDAGADMIFGHHPHRLNSLAWYRGRPIYWSLGNFVWPSLSAAGSDSAVAHVIIEPDGTILGCMLDVTIVSNGHPELDDPTVRTCSEV